MPIRYDIAAGVPQGQSFSPMNMLAQMQQMDYRDQQNALAQMQMQQAQREMQQEQGLAALFAQPNFNPLTQQGLARIAQVSPNYFRQYVTPYAGYQAEEARKAALQGGESRAMELQPFAAKKARTEADIEEAKLPGVKAEAGEKQAKSFAEQIKLGQRLMAPAFMSRTPEDMAVKYAEVYPELPETVRRRLGPRPTMEQLTAFMETPEAIEKMQEPRVVKTGELLARGGAGGQFSAAEPVYEAPMPSANGRMGRLVPDMAVDPIVEKAYRRENQLRMVPPGPARERVGAQLDIRDTLDEFENNLFGLADAGGIPRAGAAKKENWQAAFRKSATGQALGALDDSEVNSRLQALRTAATILQQQLKKGLEMGVTQMDAAKESDKLSKALANPDSIRALSEGTASLRVLRNLLGGGAPAPASRGRAGEEAPKLKPLQGTIDLMDMRP